MRGITLKLASMAVLVPALLIGTHVQAPAANNTAAVVGGLIAGAAIGAAVTGATYPKRIYVNPPPPRPAWGGSFSPKYGVTCYPAQRACYRATGAYAANATWEVFGR